MTPVEAEAEVAETTLKAAMNRPRRRPRRAFPMAVEKTTLPGRIGGPGGRHQKTSRPTSHPKVRSPAAKKKPTSADPQKAESPGSARPSP